jgi:uncharacterized repeat protein (TIGR01451 family)
MKKELTYNKYSQYLRRFVKMQRIKNQIRLFLGLLWSVVLLMLQLGNVVPVNAAATNFDLNGYRVNLAGGNTFSANWTNGDLGNTWEEGDWIPYTLTITNVQTDYLNLSGFPDIVLGYHFYHSVHGGVFMDLVRDIQVGTTTLDDSHGFPTAAGTPQPNTYAGAHAGQLDPAEHVWTGFNLLNLPNTQVNRNPDGSLDTWPGTDTHAIIIHPSDLTGHGISTGANTIVIYFQMHLARSFVWNHSLQSGYSSNPTTAAWGGYVYGTDSWPTAIADGAADEPGSAGHVFLDVDGTGNQDVPAPVPPSPPGSISGHKYLDNPPIGQVTGADPGLSGWRIYLSGTLTAEPITFSFSTLTDALGAYSFTDIDDEASYTISEASQRETPPQNEYVQSYPDGTQIGSVSVATSGQGPFGWMDNLTTASPTAEGLDFANFIQSPSIDIVKDYSFTTGNGSQVGDNVTYTYTITNTGNVTLDNITVNDDKLGAITPGTTTLAPGASTTGTATLTLTQELLDAGLQTNTVTAAGSPPVGPDVNDQDNQTVTFIQNPAIHVIKTFEFTTGDGSQVNDNITFTYTVTNLGNVTLDNITLVDDKLGPITLGTTTLAPGASTTGTASLLVTSELITAGSQTNIALATGTPPSGPDVTDTASQTVHFTQGPFIDIVKDYSFTTGNGSQVGDNVTFVYTVSNIGNVTLDNITLVDDKLGPITLGTTTLPPDNSTIGTASLLVTQALLDAGFQTNIATATGTPPTGPNVSDQDNQTVTFLQTPAIHVLKTFEFTSGDGSHVGDVVTFTYTITNEGNVTLDNITLVDDKLGPITLGTTTLPPDNSTTGTATLLVTQALLDAGFQTNIAVATGTPPSGPDVTDTASQTVNFIQSPSIQIIKTYSFTTGNGSQEGDVVTFTYTVTNIGNVTLDNITLIDDQLGAITLGTTTLAPGDSTTGTASLVVTSDLITAGSQTNIAVATGTPPGGNDVTDADTNTVRFIVKNTGVGGEVQSVEILNLIISWFILAAAITGIGLFFILRRTKA